MMDTIVSLEFAALVLVFGAISIAAAVLDHMGYIHIRVYARKARRVVIYGGIMVTLLIVTLIGILQVVGIGPELPEWGQAVVIYSTAGFLVFLIPLELLRQYLTGRNKTELHCTEPENGDFGVWALSVTDWKNLTVENENGEELNRTDLAQVKSESGREAYECISYDPETNIAVATWLADKTPSEVRARESSVRYIKNRANELVNAAIDVIAQREEITHEQALEEMLRNVEMRENAMLESDTSRTDFEEVLMDDGVEEAGQASIENHAESRVNPGDDDEQ